MRTVVSMRATSRWRYGQIASQIAKVSELCPVSEKNPSSFPAGVKVGVAEQQDLGRRPAGQARAGHSARRSTVEFDEAAKQVVVARNDDSRQARALHGLTRALDPEHGRAA